MEAEFGQYTYTRHEWVLPSPCVVGEFYKALTSAEHELPEERRQWDDALTVEARDDEIVIWWEETSPAAAHPETTPGEAG